MRIDTPLDEDFLLINKLSATEGISELFQFEVELLHDEGEETSDEPTIVEMTDILGQEVSITITQGDETTRQLNGIVNWFSQGNRDGRFTQYYATIVPKIWLLTQNSQSRIFQQKSVPDILKEVFAEYEMAEPKFEVQQDQYKPRDYCVQYQETDFDFVSRLMEEEGIYYYFEFADNTHQMIIADTPQSHYDCPSKHEIDFFTEVKDEPEYVTAIYTWQTDYRLQTGMVTNWDFNFQIPKKPLQGSATSLFNAGGNQELEKYDYPGGYGRKYDDVTPDGKSQKGTLSDVFTDNERTVKTRQEELDARYRNFRATSDCCSFTPGYRFKMMTHPVKDFNVLHTLVSVNHEVIQSPDYVSDQNVANAYQNSFTCLFHGSNPPFRPARKTPKPLVRGSQTAFVVGPEGEEIFTDQYGRIKVQFHWDRDASDGKNSSCWIRVAQSWAGKNWGTMFIPRVGMEVICEFLEGDPDRPIVTGCVYNAEAMPPYKLPDEKTKMTIKSDSSVGGQGFNEFRFEDLKGHEQIFMHGEKDLDVRIKNDRREWTGNDQHLVVKRDRREKIESDTHLIVGRDQIEKIERDRHVHVVYNEIIHIDKNQSIKVGADLVTEATGKISLKGTGGVVIESPAGITLKCGGSLVHVHPGGVDIVGPMVKINSGGSGGSAGSLDPLLKPAIADDADDAKPGTKISLEKRSAARKEKRHKEDKNKKGWIKIKLIDEAGKPVKGVPYKITLPNGRHKSGLTNKDGKGEAKGFDPGSCKVTFFPALDEAAWEDA